MADKVRDVQMQIELLQIKEKLHKEKAAVAEQNCKELRNLHETCSPALKEIYKDELEAAMVILETERQMAQKAEHNWKQLVSPTSEIVMPSGAATSEPLFYDKRRGTTESQQTAILEKRFAALCALKGLDFDEFLLALNMNKPGTWDNMVFKCYQTTEAHTHFIQLEHKKDENNALDNNFLLRGKGKSKYFGNFLTIKEKFNKPNNTNEMYRNEDFEKAQFVLNTCLKYQPSKQTSSTAQTTHLLSTNPEGCVTVFNKNTDPDLYRKLKGKISNDQDENVDIFFNKFRLLTEQDDCETLKLTISAKLGAFIRIYLKVPGISLCDVFLQYIQDWAMKSGQSDFLNKRTLINFLTVEAEELQKRCSS